MPTTAPVPPAGATVLLRGRGDVDGQPGDEVITLFSDGTLHAGHWVGRVALTGAGDYFMGEQAGIRVEVLDGSVGSHVVVVGLPTAEEEDPPNRWQAFRPDGALLRRILDTTPGSYGVTALRFPGDGTVRYTQDGWTACQGTAGQDVAPVHEITRGSDGGGDLVEVKRTPTGAIQACDQLAACPWIYVEGAGGPVKVGEILRELRGKTSSALQALELPAAPSGPLVLRVAEEEDEVTFLDEIFVEADGVRIYPASCAAAATPAYCQADHVPLRMRRGDVLALTFELPAATAPVVFARGYYVPTPSRP